MKKSFLILTLLLFSLPLVLAYNGEQIGETIFSISIMKQFGSWGYGSFSPQQLFDNEWVMFALIFVAFFAFTFFALAKTMKESRGGAAVIAAVVSLFISVAISRQDYFYGYVGQTIGDYILLAALVLGAIIIIKFLMGIIGGVGIFVILGILHFVARSIDPWDVLPYELLHTNLVPIWEFVGNTTFLIIVIAAFLILLLYSGRREDISGWLWGRRRGGGGGPAIIVGRN